MLFRLFSLYCRKEHRCVSCLYNFTMFVLYSHNLLQVFNRFSPVTHDVDVWLHTFDLSFNDILSNFHFRQCNTQSLCSCIYRFPSQSHSYFQSYLTANRNFHLGFFAGRAINPRRLKDHEYDREKVDGGKAKGRKHKSFFPLFHLFSVKCRIPAYGLRVSFLDKIQRQDLGLKKGMLV